MEEGHRDGKSSEIHLENDKVLAEKNRTRTMKTPAQIQALENFYSENKYPSDTMKAEISEVTGLTETQVYGWFCHQRLKDKELHFSSVAGGPEHSSGVVQDHGSGHRPDSCGSTKLGGFDTKEVESGRVILPQLSGAELVISGKKRSVYDTSSGCSSSLRALPGNNILKPTYMENSRYLPPKSSLDIPAAKRRSGPSGYLKLLNRPSENPAVTAVKKQLGSLYTEDGPTLGVDFDSPPPGSFKSKQVQVHENYGRREGISPAPGGILNLDQHPKFGKGFEIGSSGPSLGMKRDRASFKVPQGSDGLDIVGHQNVSTSTCDNIWILALPRRGSAKGSRIGKTGGSKIKIPKKNDIIALKRPLDGLPPPQQEPSIKKQSVAPACDATDPAIRSGGEPGIGGSVSDEKEAKSGAETSSSVD
ncbi:uncharacterized protein LOC127259007 isoform X1 [Andrographis paniculata]|uniref:uncharacterized protein LOC127259007 isoform X1 n=1 Tax=Andrographis paniculata TaxID=175694 RepID=UPI0021E70765|nr:uncharacterized protein LOC127259007 isoform X1 [Andrographis paniculata]XP_051142082.1 uncharacterized protein LOC127259007 isoform X1 [Andrographis paniculata]